jgi:autotransporter-associated beta strand protein
VNDLAADLSFAGLTFDSGPRTYLLSGSRIALGGTVLNSSTNTHRINFDMVLDATRTFNVANGNLFLNGTLSGAGGVTQSGGTAKVLVLKGTNTYQGVTTVSGSILRIESDQALGSTDSGTVVGSIPNDNKMLHLANVNVTGEAVTLYGKGDNNGALQSVAGSNTWGGKVILGAAGENRLGNSAATGMLVVSGVIEGPAGNHMTVRNKDDSGPTVLANTNAYLGETQVIVGTLRLSGGDDRLPTNTVVNVGNGSNVNWALLDLNGCNQTVGGLTQAGSTMPRKVTNLASNKVATLTANLYKPYTYSASFDGYLNLVKSGPSNLTLSAANYHYGQTVVREGALILNGPSALQDSTLNTGDGPMGVLAFGTNTMISFGGLVGTNDLVMTNRFGAAMQLRIRGSQSTTYDGQILVGSDFTKTGSGLFTMNNTNLYTGRTTLAGGTLRVLSEDSFGAYPESYVADQIIFDGGTFRTETNFVLAANNRGVSLAAGGGTLWTGNRDAVLTVDKLLTGPGGLDAKGKGVTLLSVSNAYDGVTTVGSALSEEPCVLRVLNKDSLGSSAAGAVVTTGSQLELANGLTVSEGVTINGAGNTVEPPPPSSPSSNRGALQAAAGATAEWAGPMLLGSNQARLGAQNNGHLIVSGVIDDGAASYALRISTNPGDRTRGVEFRAHNTYNGSTDLTRGMLFLGISDAISPTSILDVHWASSNNSELSGLDTKGFDQTVAGLKNSGITGANALITNSSLTVSTLTVSQSVDTVYSGTIRGPIALVKDGAGSLTLGFPTYYSGLTTVRGGTLALGASGVIPSGNAILLSGGTFDVSGTTNTFASLTVTSDSTLNIGAGMLSFTVQTADAWLGQLTLTGELGTTSLRFQPLLTVSQLDSIRYEGKRVMQNSNGYLVPWFGTLLQMY